LSKVVAGAGVVLTANYHLSTCPVDIRKMREEELGCPPTPLVYPDDMETGFATKLFNSVGDTTHRLFGYHIAKLDNPKSRAALMKLKGVVSDEEFEQTEKAFNLSSKAMDPEKGSSPLHTLVMSSFTEKALNARYVVEKTYVEKKEEYDKEKLKPQIIVTGLPRTGSTFLHQLLSQDPNCRFLSSWEQQMPVPFPTKETYKTDVRIKQAQGFQLMADKFVTNYNKYFRMYHDVDGAQVEEELYVILHTLALPLSWPWSDDHWKWYMEPNKDYAYQYLKKFLKMSQYHHSPQSHWVLKSPVHGWHFAELMRTFNDNRVIVVTHREPAKVVGSLGKLHSFIATLCLRNTKDDPFLAQESFGKNTVTICKALTDCISQTRKELDPAVEKEILDIEFQDIVADPMMVVERIYERAGIELTKEAKESMENYLEENAKQRKKNKGSHHCPYSLEEFALTEETVKEAFKDYRKERNYDKGDEQ